MVRIERVDHEDGLYPPACALRERELLAQVGLDLARYREMFPGVDEASEHFVAIEDGEVIGCVLLRTVEGASVGDGGDGEGVLSQMVVDGSAQGRGVGRLLVEALLARAFGALGLDSVWCHVRREAYGFYEKMGWVHEGEEFEEVGVTHRTMRIGRAEWPGAAERG